MASSNNSLELSINPGLNLNMRVQNSISFKAPSPSKSPSLSIHISSSSLMPCNPNKAEFLFKLWNVITPFSSSINNRNPLPSSFIKPSAPNFSTMAGKKSSNTTPFLDPIDDQASIHVKKIKDPFVYNTFLIAWSLVCMERLQDGGSIYIHGGINERIQEEDLKRIKKEIERKCWRKEGRWGWQQRYR